MIYEQDLAVFDPLTMTRLLDAVVARWYCITDVRITIIVIVRWIRMSQCQGEKSFLHPKTPLPCCSISSLCWAAKAKEENFIKSATCTKTLCHECDTVAKRPRAWHFHSTRHKKLTLNALWPFPTFSWSTEPCRNHPTNLILVCYSIIYIVIAENWVWFLSLLDTFDIPPPPYTPEDPLPSAPPSTDIKSPTPNIHLNTSDASVAGEYMM